MLRSVDDHDVLHIVHLKDHSELASPCGEEALELTP
jgi:hypothetical protein